MSLLCISLFGKFDVRRGQQTLTALDAHKIQELFCYLLLYRDRCHPRETLADLLWGNSSTAQSKRYLRKALWQLQAALDAPTEPHDGRVLLVESDWVQLNPEAELWLDVAEFEGTWNLVQGVPGGELDSRRVQTLQGAVDLYRGDLLEGWYQDWCLYERERLLHMYLAMLDKLMDYCEVHRQCEIGLAYGTIILRYDRARERTHRRLMRLYYLARNRTAALRQYERCVAALDEELDVRPAKRTVVLYEQIRADQLDWPPLTVADAPVSSETLALPLLKVLDRLRQLHQDLVDIQRQVQQDIEALKLPLSRKD